MPTKASPLQPASLKDVRLVSGLLAERQRINREVTLPLQRERSQSRIDAIRLTWKPGDPDQPHQFWDSDVAKWIEAAAYSLATHPDASLEAQVDEVVELLAAAQQPDGYLNTYFTVVRPKDRWTNLRDDHELYCAGHLIEAAVAYHEATGKDRLLRVLCRYADYIATVFGRGKGQLRGYPGHEEIELALVKLYRATGERRYLDLATYFVDERGRQPHYFNAEAKRRGEKTGLPHYMTDFDYCQAHVPVREQTDAEGHAVRLGYLFAGAADVAGELDDRALLQACRRIWKSITERRMYITGGIGSAAIGERFTYDYDLPNEQAHAETCAAIALVFFAHRMLQIERDGRYADVMERAMYNGVLPGVSLDGSRFFYDNYLAVDPGYHDFARRKPSVRQGWFGCACCPPNVARLLASLGTYMYSESSRGLWVHLYGASTWRTQISGVPVEISQQTNYPWDGQVTLTVSTDTEVSFPLHLRLPGWCEKATLTIEGKRVDAQKSAKRGYVGINRTWRKGDTVTLDMAMPVQRVWSHPSVRHDAGRVALQRGPVVYCIEEVDNGKGLAGLSLPRDGKIEHQWRPRLLGGVVTLKAKATRAEAKDWRGDLYRIVPPRRKAAAVTAVPYFAWNNRREPGEMMVWLPES